MSRPRQYHFQFPSEADALRFARVVAWKHGDVALQRDGCWVSVIDGSETGQELDLLALALRIDPKDIV